MMHEVFAIVLNFRTPEKTLACLESLLRDSVRKCVLVDNSEDGGRSLKSMRAGLDRLRKLGMNVLVEDPGRNLGFAAGVNRATAVIRKRGIFDVLILNSDARLLPGTVQALSLAIEQDVTKKAAVSVPKIRNGTTSLYSSPFIYYNRWLGILSSHPLLSSFPFVSGACMLISADVAFNHVLDEDFFFYGEDVAFCHSLIGMNKKCLVVEHAEVLHEGSASSRNGSLFYEYHINRSHLLLAGKLGKNRLDLAVMLMGRMLFLPCRALVRSVRFGSVAPLKGLSMAACDVLRGRRRTLTPPATV